MKKKSELRKKMKRSTREQQKALHDEIEKIDMCIGEEIAVENWKNVENNFALLSRTDGSVNVNGMWKMKNKMFPRHPVGMPTVKKNAEGKLVTSQEELLTLYKETFIHRLRHRPIREEYSDFFELKMKLCKERLIYSERNKSQSWTEEQFIKILQNLKNNKCRDPHGLVNEIFKLKNIGVDLFNSLFELLNRIKTELMIPNFMKYTDIHTVYKGKGERSSLENQRGIFIVNIFRALLFKLIYVSEYENIAPCISDSNIGGQKGKSVVNNLFILNGIINEAVQKKLKCDLQIVDYAQCFDSLSLEECINDLFDANLQNDHLSLIYKINSTNEVSIQTEMGKTKRQCVERIVTQGEVLSPIICSVQVGSIGKQCIENNKLLYTYREGVKLPPLGVAEGVKIPPLGMVDDIATVSKCGVDSVQMNAYLNAKTNLKKLQFGVTKCKKMHLGPPSPCCPELFVDKWKLEKVDQFSYGVSSLVDIEDGEYLMDDSKAEKYLGMVVSRDGSNKKNIESRISKGIAASNEIMSIVNEN